MAKFEEAGIILAAKEASKFISEIRKSYKEVNTLTETSKKAAAEVTKAGTQIAQSAQKSSNSIVEAEKKVAAVRAEQRAALKAIAEAEAKLNQIRNQAKAQPRNEAGQFTKRTSEQEAEAARQAAAAEKELKDAQDARDEIVKRLTSSQKELNDAMRAAGTEAKVNIGGRDVTLGGGVAALNPEFVASMTQGKQVTQELEEETKQLGDTTEKTEKKVAGLGSRLLAVAKAAAIAFVSYKALGILSDIIKSTIELGSETFKLQQELGGTAREMSGLIFAARQFNIEPTKLATTLSIFSRQLALVEQNAAGLNTRGQQSTRVLAGLGLQVLDTNGKLRPTLDILKDLANQFAATADGALKAGIAEQLFGQSGADLIPFLNQGAAGIDALIAKAEELGVVFTDEGAKAAFQFAQSQRELSAAFQGVKIAIGNEILPVLLGLTRALTEFLTNNRGDITTFVQDIGKIGKAFTTGFLVLIQPLRFGFKLIEGALSFMPKNEAKIVASILAIGAAFAWALPGGKLIKGLTAITAALAAATANSGQHLNERITDKLNKAVGIDLFGNLNIPGKIRDLLGLEDVANDVDKFFNDLTEDVEGTGDAAKKAGLDLEGLTDAELREIEVIQTLAAAFRDSSLAAQETTSVLEGLGLFGEVSRELAEKLGLSAEAAGNVQGYDAFIAAQERAKNKAFDLTRSLATLAQAFVESANVYKEIVLSIARSALDAAKAAASDVLGAPTREQANLGVSAATQQLQQARTAALINPLIAPLSQQSRILEKQLEAMSDRIEEATKAQKAQEKAQKEAQERAEKAADKAVDLARQQLDAMKLANLKAQIAWERMNARLERLIDATKQQASELQERFLKNNEALQKQINEAIGRGDSGTALELVDQQRAATKAYRSESEALRKREQQLVAEQKRKRLDEEERQREARLREALKQVSIDQIEAARKEIKAREHNTDAIDKQIEALNLQKDAIEKQRDLIEGQIEQLEDINAAEAERGARIQEQLAVLQAETAVLKARAEAADATLVTQEEQKRLTEELIGLISRQSEAVKTLSTELGIHFLRSVEEARKQAEFFGSALRIATDVDFRQKFITQGVDFAGERARIFGLALESSADAVRRWSIEAVSAQRQAQQRPTDDSSLFRIFRTLGQLSAGANSGPLHGPAFAEGGLVSRPTLAWIAENRRQELILPITNRQRSRELLAQLPAGLLASLLPSGRGTTVFSPSITVTGETLDSMEAIAIRAVRASFRDARVTSARSGGLITQGIGPSR